MKIQEIFRRINGSNEYNTIPKIETNRKEEAEKIYKI